MFLDEVVTNNRQFVNCGIEKSVDLFFEIFKWSCMGFNGFEDAFHLCDNTGIVHLSTGTVNVCTHYGVLIHADIIDADTMSLRIIDAFNKRNILHYRSLIS